MSENRRGINLWDSLEGTSGQDFDLGLKVMEDQLRIQNEIASVERERGLALERTREQQQLMSREAERGLQALRSEASDSGYAAQIERGTGQIAEAESAFTEMTSSCEKFTTSTGTGMKTLFNTLFKGELSSAKDHWDVFCNSLIKTWSGVLAKMASRGFQDLLGNLFGWIGGSGLGGGGGSFDNLSQIESALAFHSGGIVGRDGTYRSANPLLFAEAPRLHSGLAPDEFPAILQRGEAVIPRGGVRSENSRAGQPQALNVQVQIDNQSSTPLKLEQGSITRDLDKIVVGIVAKDIDQYGVLGRMLRKK